MRDVKVVENIAYNSDTGKAGLLDLYLPELAEGETAPLVIYFHGGGLESGDKADDAGVYKQLSANGVVVASANYRMYPDYGYPVFIEDAAAAVAYIMKHIGEYASCDKVWIGGISAGAYLSMMLHFVPEFLEKCGVNEKEIFGYLFDDGQPTVHFNVLRERGEDTGAVRVDETAAIYYLTKPHEVNKKQHYLFVWTSDDIPGRPEQNALMIKTMENYGYEKSQLESYVMEGYGHAAHVWEKDEAGNYPYADFLWEYLKKFG